MPCLVSLADHQGFFAAFFAGARFAVDRLFAAFFAGARLTDFLAGARRTAFLAGGRFFAVFRAGARLFAATATVASLWRWSFAIRPTNRPRRRRGWSAAQKCVSPIHRARSASRAVFEVGALITAQRSYGASRPKERRVVAPALRSDSGASHIGAITLE